MVRAVGATMTRHRAVTGYALLLGLSGWAWLAAVWQPVMPSVAAVVLFGLALIVEAARIRVPPADPHSLVGVVMLAAVLILGAVPGALLAGVTAGLTGVLFAARSATPLRFGPWLARPLLRSGVRIIAVLGGVQAAAWFGDPRADLVAFAALALTASSVIQLNRVLREAIQGGRSGVITWWHSARGPILAIDLAPLPLAWLGARGALELGAAASAIAAGALLALSLVVRRSVIDLRRQSRAVRELALLNETSRAIIHAELDVDALAQLIYREASRVVDTAWFHLGLFEPGSDTYTLLVRVQQRVHLPALTVNVPAGDGIVGWMRQSREPLLVRDFASEMAQLPARPRYQSDRPPRSGIYVPLLDGGTMIGSLSIQSEQIGAFDADDLRLLSLIADQAATAISRARVFAEARERAVQLQAIQAVSERISAIRDLDELLASVVHLIRERFGYHPVHIYVLEGATLVFRASTADPRLLPWHEFQPTITGSGLIGAAAIGGEAIMVNDVREDSRYISDDPETRAELAVPFRFGDALIGVLDVQSTEVGRFQRSDRFVMQTLADQLAVAVESARAFTAQREEAWTLNVLLQVAENLAQTTTLPDLVATAVRLPPLLLGCERCSVVAWEPSAQQFRLLGSYGAPSALQDAWRATPIAAEAAPALLQALAGDMPVLAPADRAGCPPAWRALGGAHLWLVPLRTRGSSLGLLAVDYASSPPLRLTRERDLLAGIGRQLASALEGALLAREAADAARFEQELRVAREIQTALLPAALPRIAGWQLAAEWRAARLVGGDFYDVWWLPHRAADGASGSPGPVVPPGATGEALGFVIADVSDKGVPAALFMALSRSLVRAGALDGSPPAVALTRANRWIARDSESGMFVTLFYGILDPGSGMLRFCCAGHNPPLHYAAAGGAISELRTPGIALGVLDEVALAEREVCLQPGDMLLCYTDGVTEAMDPAGRLFGLERLTTLLAATAHASPQQVIDALNRALNQHSQGQISDDVTLIVIKRMP
jgi:serine phosphatase RsbU (regulator of sigma subunit)/putative methionine-R-sulfoxide reductase with GAF domain